MEEKQKSNRARLRLYPLKFDEVISDVLKVKPKQKAEPERKAGTRKRKSK